MTEIRPFNIDVTDQMLDELRRRISETRWPHKELVDDRSQGVQLATLQALARYWERDYDWRLCEKRLNALPEFKTKIDGVDIHFIHVQSRHENALPLIMTHGWPGSVIELLETIGPLTDPTAHGGDAEDAFHLVLPSLPGYGFSAEPTEVGWDPARIARAWAELMQRLGYARYVAQGGDLGAIVTDVMGRQAPEGLVGIHMNLLVTTLGAPTPPPGNTEEERAALNSIMTFTTSGFGYFLEQSTRPQTIGYAVLDSPVALAAWLLDHDTDSYEKISRRLPRRAAVGQPHAGPDRRQHHALLADRHRCVCRAHLLGDGTSPSHGSRPRTSGGVDPDRLHHVSRRDLPRPAHLGRAVLPQPHLLQRGRQGRALRGVGGARGFRL